MIGNYQIYLKVEIMVKEQQLKLYKTSDIAPDGRAQCSILIHNQILLWMAEPRAGAVPNGAGFDASGAPHCRGHRNPNYEQPTPKIFPGSWQLCFPLLPYPFSLL